MRGDARPVVALGVDARDVLWAVGSVANLHRLPFDAAMTLRSHPAPHSVGTLIEALQALGAEVDLLPIPSGRRAALPLPCIALRLERKAGEEEETARPALLVRIDGDRFVLFEAGSNVPVTVSAADFAGRHAGVVLRIDRREARRVGDDPPPARPFGFRWFVPELLRHRRIWHEVLAASLALQLLALALPLLSQVVIDKVIVHRTTSTLAVIAAALVGVVLFSSAIGWIRQYLVIHTGNRVDAVLGVAVFRHLFALPPRYFEQRPTGVLTARLAGIETIREFLTGAAITLVLDVPFVVVFLAVMIVYSVPLTLIALAVVTLLVVASAVAAPMLQKRFDAQFLASARTQAFLTENIAGIETVKSLQLEPVLGSRYERLLARYLEAGFRTRQLANSYTTVTGTLEQLLSASILCAGAYIVMTSPSFTIGMLVAFQMFAARVAQPLLRLTSLWQQFQQAAIAVRRLADVMDVPAEPQTAASVRPVPGPASIEFAAVGFRHAADRAWIHRDLSFAVKPGECVVIRGPSGSGKSTLLKLLQGFVHAEEGAVRIDGRDTRSHAANELRARLGVVPQDTVLFAGTLLDNLQLANGSASLEHVVQACRLADVHETIDALAESYRTEVGERGAGLSGGQKQRVALARALLRRPGALLLDEPFSQLDVESADRIAAAVSKLKGSVTILIVTHAIPASLAFDRCIELGASPQTTPRPTMAFDGRDRRASGREDESVPDAGQPA